MIYSIHAIFVGCVTLLLMFYLFKYSDVVNHARKGVILDVTYIRLYILGVIVTASVMLLVASPIISLMLGVPPLEIGVILLACLACVVIGLLMIRNIERIGETIENARKEREHHKHDNKNYVKEAQAMTYILMACTIGFPIFTMYMSGLDMVTNYFMTLSLFLGFLYGVYILHRNSLINISNDEQEIREQLEKNDELMPNSDTEEINSTQSNSNEIAEPSGDATSNN